MADVGYPPRSGQAVRSLASGAFVVLLPVLLVTSIIRVLVSDVGFYEWGLRRHDAEARTGIPLAELDIAAAEIVRYFEDDSKRLEVIVIVDDDLQPLFNEREIAHMSDVKTLVAWMFRVQEAALVYVIAYVAAVFLWARERTIRALAWQVLGAMALGLSVAAAIGLFALTGFDAAWSRFHEIAFRNDLWRLDPATDRLIQMFPEPFWEDATLLVVGLSVLFAVAALALAGSYLLVSAGSPRGDR